MTRTFSTSSGIAGNAGTTGSMRPIFDAIVCDPPYGVRARSQKVGVSESKKAKPEKETEEKKEEEKEKKEEKKEEKEKVNMLTKLGQAFSKLKPTPAAPAASAAAESEPKAEAESKEEEKKEVCWCSVL